MSHIVSPSTVQKCARHIAARYYPHSRQQRADYTAGYVDGWLVRVRPGGTAEYDRGADHGLEDSALVQAGKRSMMEENGVSE